MELKLGKHPATYSKRDIRFSKYLKSATLLPTVPAEFGHENLVADYRMLANDRIGNCVIADACHQTMLWTAEGGNPADFDDNCAIEAYSDITGFVMGDDSTDNGTPIRDCMKYRSTKGIRDVTGKRHKIGAYATIEPGDIERLRLATYLFSATTIGILFPESAAEQFENGEVWDVVSSEQPDEGHDIPVLADRGGNLWCVTWKRLQRMTQAFVKKYCDEAWMILSQEFVRNGVSPEGFDLTALLEDVDSVTA